MYAIFTGLCGIHHSTCTYPSSLTSHSSPAAPLSPSAELDYPHKNGCLSRRPRCLCGPGCPGGPPRPHRGARHPLRGLHLGVRRALCVPPLPSSHVSGLDTSAVGPGRVIGRVETGELFRASSAAGSRRTGRATDRCISSRGRRIQFTASRARVSYPCAQSGVSPPPEDSGHDPITPCAQAGPSPLKG